jgi:hypothetical protein
VAPALAALETLRSLGAGYPLPKMGKAAMLALHIRVKRVGLSSSPPNAPTTSARAGMIQNDRNPL